MAAGVIFFQAGTGLIYINGRVYHGAGDNPYARGNMWALNYRLVFLPWLIKAWPLAILSHAGKSTVYTVHHYMHMYAVRTLRIMLLIGLCNRECRADIPSSMVEAS